MSNITNSSSNNLQNNFDKITWEEVEKLSITGLLGPHNDIELALVILGKKPSMLATEYIIERIRRYKIEDLEIKLIPQLKDVDVRCYRYVIYRKGNNEIYDKMVSAFEVNKQTRPYKVGINSLSHDIALGRVLGYTDADIAQFIVTNFNKETFEKWQGLNESMC